MEYAIIVTPQFEKDVKYYRQKKGYTKIEEDIEEILTDLEKGNFVGDEISGLRLPDNESTYKVRVANSSINVGKSNGFRMIYYVIKNDCEIYLLTIYSKKDRENLANHVIIDLIRTYCA